MKSKIRQYLLKKSAFGNLDKILEMYATGELKQLLSGYEDVRIFPSLSRGNKTVQVNYRFQNICVTLDFFESRYDYVIYPMGTSADDLEMLFTKNAYPENFGPELLINEIDVNIKNHPALKDISAAEKKRKIYSLLAGLSFCPPTALIVCTTVYCLTTGNIVKLNVWWLICFIVIPLILWWVFDSKAKQMK